MATSSDAVVPLIVEGLVMQHVFVLGTGRCGSTLVQEVLARHPGTSWMSNVEDRLPAVSARAPLARLYRRLPAAATVKGRVRLAPSEGYRALGSRVSPALAAPARDLLAEDATPWLAERTREFFAPTRGDAGGGTFLHKFTGWPRAGFLSAVWPDAKFVHVVRDGRAVANSWLQMPWWRGYATDAGGSFGPLPAAYRAEWEASGRSFPLRAGLEWKMLLDAFEAAEERCKPDNWLEVRYEDVVADPGAAFGQLLDFCGLDRSPGFDRGLARHSFSPGRTEAFRRDLRAEDVSLLTDSLGDHLRRHGYPLEPAS